MMFRQNSLHIVPTLNIYNFLQWESSKALQRQSFLCCVDNFIIHTYQKKKNHDSCLINVLRRFSKFVQSLEGPKDCLFVDFINLKFIEEIKGLFSKCVFKKSFLFLKKKQEFSKVKNTFGKFAMKIIF